MPQVINIPDLGKVRFPDEMSDAQIEEAIKYKVVPQLLQERYDAIELEPVARQEPAAFAERPAEPSSVETPSLKPASPFELEPPRRATLPGTFGSPAQVGVPETAFTSPFAEAKARAESPEAEAQTRKLQTGLIQIPRLTEEEADSLLREAGGIPPPGMAKVVQGVHAGIADLVEGLTTPEMLATFPWLATPGGVGTAIRGLVTADLALGSAGLLPEIYKATQRGDVAEVARLSTGYGANALMALGLGKKVGTEVKGYLKKPEIEASAARASEAGLTQSAETLKEIAREEPAKPPPLPSAPEAKPTPSQPVAPPEPTKSAQAEPTPKAETATPVSAKKPWQMTRKEFLDQKLSKLQQEILSNRGKPNAGELNAEATQRYLESTRHVDSVEQALREGKPVPPEVLADYPDLQKAAPKPAGPEPPSGPGMVGMGAAAAGESGRGFMAPIASKLALIDAERVKRGQQPIPKPDTVRDSEALARAMVKIDEDYRFPDRLAAEINAKPRAIEDWENHALVIREIEYRQELDKAQRDVAKAFEDGREADRIDAMARIEDWNIRLDTIENAMRQAGASLGRGMRARRVMLADDFSLVGLTRQFRAARGGANVTEAEMAELQRIADNYKAAYEKSEVLRQTAEMKMAEEEARRALAELKLAQAPKLKYSQYVLDIAEKWAEEWKKDADEAAKELFSMMSSPGPRQVLLVARIVRGIVADVGMDVAKISAALIKQFGKSIEPYIEQGISVARDMMESAIKKVPAAAQDQVREKVTRTTPTIESVAAKITDKVAGGEPENITPQVKKMAELLWEQGIGELKPMIAELQKILSAIIPDITEQQTMDALSGRGRFWRASQKEAKKAIRDLSTQARLVSHGMDVVAGKPLPRTGYQPDPMSEAGRRALQELEDLKRKYGVTVTDPATQLASALQARKTYLKNMMADMREAISTGKRMVRGQNKIMDDSELAAVRRDYDDIRKQYQEAFPKEPLTDAQKIERAITSIDREIAKIEGQIKSGSLYPEARVPEKLSSPELEARRARLEALKMGRDELRLLDKAHQEALLQKKIVRRSRELDEAIENVVNQINTGQIETSIKRGVLPELKDKVEELAELNKIKAKLRAAQKGKTPSEKEAEELAKIQAKIEKTIEEINTGHIELEPKPVRQISEARAALQGELAELNKIKMILRNALTAEEDLQRSFARRLAQIEREKAFWADKLARGDFEPRKAKPPLDISKDKPTMEALAELETIKQEWLQRAAEEKLKNLKGWAKAQDLFWESINLHRSVISGYDLSALRQALPVAINPFRVVATLREVGQMIKSLKPGQAEIYWQEIVNRPNSLNGNYERMNLRLVHPNEIKLSAQDEGLRGRWAAKIPVLRESQKAFTTFLNMVRADSADALLASTSNKSTEAIRAIGAAVNDLTGYGDVGTGKVGQVTDALAKFLWSPRLLMSRIRILTGASMYKGTWETRRLIAQEYAKTLIGMGTLYTLAYMAGFEVEDDPRSGFFGKLKDGHVYIDPMGGLIQPTVLATRLATGETKTMKGEITPALPFESTARFLRSKIHPSMTLGFDMVTYLNQAKPKNIVGEPITPQSLAKQVIGPMSWQDVFDVMEEAGVEKGIAYQIFSLFGAGVQIAEEKDKQR